MTADNTSGDDFTLGVLLLTKDTTCKRLIGRTYSVLILTVSIQLFISFFADDIRISVLFIIIKSNSHLITDTRVVVIPHSRVVHIVGKHITRTMTQIVGRTEYEIECHILILCFIMHIGYSRIICIGCVKILLRSMLFQIVISTYIRICLITRQHHITLRIGVFANCTLCDGGIYLTFKPRLICSRKHLVTPVINRIACMIGDTIDDDTVLTQRLTVLATICIEVWLYIAQGHLTM